MRNERKERGLKQVSCHSFVLHSARIFVVAEVQSLEPFRALISIKYKQLKCTVNFPDCLWDYQSLREVVASFLGCHLNGCHTLRLDPLSHLGHNFAAKSVAITVNCLQFDPQKQFGTKQSTLAHYPGLFYTSATPTDLWPWYEIR